MKTKIYFPLIFLVSLFLGCTKEEDLQEEESTTNDTLVFEVTPSAQFESGDTINAGDSLVFSWESNADRTTVNFGNNFQVLPKNGRLVLRPTVNLVVTFEFILKQQEKSESFQINIKNNHNPSPFKINLMSCEPGIYYGDSTLISVSVDGPIDSLTVTPSLKGFSGQPGAFNTGRLTESKNYVFEGYSSGSLVTTSNITIWVMPLPDYLKGYLIEEPFYFDSVWVKSNLSDPWEYISTGYSMTDKHIFYSSGKYEVYTSENVLVNQCDWQFYSINSFVLYWNVRFILELNENTLDYWSVYQTYPDTTYIRCKFKHL